MTELQKAGKLQCNVPLDFGISDLRFSGYPAFVTDAVYKTIQRSVKSKHFRTIQVQISCSC